MAALVFTNHLQGIAPSGESHYGGATVGAVLQGAFADHPRLRSYILDDQGRVRKHVIIFVDEQQTPRGTELDASVAAESKVYVLQALSGGMDRGRGA